MTTVPSGPPGPAGPAGAPTVGRYTLLAKLGEGGMGVVHLARGPEGQRVALKVLRDHVVGDDEGRSRLAREVTTLRRVRSPRVAEVYDAEPWGDRPFVVTRYVPGQSLHQHVRTEGPLAETDVRYLALGLAEAMVAVHEAGVLHRDIKPSNVLLEGRAPVLIDFGLAKLADDSRLTVTGWLMGTPGYLAPEVLYGDDPTPASDVHAWAATVVYAASGTSPYGGGPAMAVMDRARRGEYDVTALPVDLRPLIERCLSAAPQERPTGPELVSRLGALQAPPVPTPGESFPEPFAEPFNDAGTTASPMRPATLPLQNPGAPPLQRPVPGDRPAPSYQPAPRPAPATSGPLRLATTLGLGFVAAATVGLAPYLGALLLMIVVWLLRTASVNGDAHLQRQALRGARRSDGLVRTMAWPWHLFVAVWGSLALVASASCAAVVVGASAALLGQPEWRSVLLGGAAFALALWWGPGSSRLRARIRRFVWRVAAPSQTGVAWVLGCWLLAVVLVIVRIQTDVVWAPAAGSPLDLLPDLW